MNIVFTNFCNKNCPYCFAKDKLTFAKPTSSDHIKLSELKIIIEYLKKMDMTVEYAVGIIGGEPTLHPNFKRAVEMIIKAGFKIKVFSNGLIPKDIVLFLKELNNAGKCYILLNINSPESYTREEWLTINKTASLFNNKLVSLSFNIYRLDFDMEFLIAFINRYNLNRGIRIGLAHPILGGNNQYIDIPDYPLITAKIVDFAVKSREKRVFLSFDCGFTLCSFTDEQLGKLLRSGTQPLFSCQPVIDIGPGLTLWYCFATSNIMNKKLTDFKNLKEIYDFYKEKFGTFKRVGATNRCFKCEYLKLNICPGGCLSHTIKTFKLGNRLKRLT